MSTPLPEPTTPPSVKPTNLRSKRKRSQKKAASRLVQSSRRTEADLVARNERTYSKVKMPKLAWETVGRLAAEEAEMATVATSELAPKASKKPLNLRPIIRVLAFFFFLSLDVVLGRQFMQLMPSAVPPAVEEPLRKVLVMPKTEPESTILSSDQPEEIELTPEVVADEINKYRGDRKIAPLTLNTKLSESAQILLEGAKEVGYENYDSTDMETIKAAFKESGYQYSWINSHYLIGPVLASHILQSLLSDDRGAEMILNKEFEDIGVATDLYVDKDRRVHGVVFQLLGQPAKNQPTSSQKKIPGGKKSAVQEPDPRDIPDNEVIQALNNYRQSHKLPPLNVDANLCTYAAKRAEDLRQFGGLDNHAGFTKDLEDQDNLPAGIAEYPRGRNIGENLAHQHCKNMTTGESLYAETGTALIEWCFDSSTKGHREAQLSKTFKNVCVRHADQMYVVTFGS